MARIEGPIVAALQGVFAENWLECCGEILTSPRHWPALDAGRPGRGDARQELARPTAPPSSRVVFQMLIEGAVATIDISTPYFLPDRALRRALVARRAARRPRARHRARAASPTSGSSGWPAGACTASCSKAASASTSTGRR